MVSCRIVMGSWHSTIFASLLFIFWLVAPWSIIPYCILADAKYILFSFKLYWFLLLRPFASVMINIQNLPIYKVKCYKYTMANNYLFDQHIFLEFNATVRERCVRNFALRVFQNFSAVSPPWRELPLLIITGPSKMFFEHLRSGGSTGSQEVCSNAA